jgi:chorismate mutase
MAVRGIRGATCVTADDPQQIRESTQELIQQILQRNGIDDFNDIISAIFTTTGDLSSAFPAEAARHIGMNLVPLLCAQEIPVDGSLPLCIRALLHVNSDLSPAEIEHVYLGEAQKLRPDMKSAQ